MSSTVIFWLKRGIVPTQYRAFAPHKAASDPDIDVVATGGAGSDLGEQGQQLRGAGCGGKPGFEPMPQRDLYLLLCMQTHHSRPVSIVVL